MNRRQFTSASISAFALLPFGSYAHAETVPGEWRHSSHLFGNAWDVLGTATEGEVELVNVGLEDGFRVNGVIHNNSEDYAFMTTLVSADPEIPMFYGGTTVQYIIPLGGYALVSTMLQLGLELESVDDLPELAVESVTPVEAEAEFVHMYETVRLAVQDFSFAGDTASYTLQNMYDADVTSYIGMMLRFDDDGVVTNHTILNDGERIPAGSSRKLQNFILYDTTPEDLFLVGFYGLVD